MLIAKVGNNNDAGPVETGKGTKEEPWVNVNTVFLNEKIQCYCKNFCCLYVRVIITGTVDYYLNGKGTDFYGKLILDFQTNLNYTYIRSPDDSKGISFYLIQNLKGVHFYNININIYVANTTTESKGQVDIHFYCFSGCSYSTFYNNTASVSMYNNVSGTGANDHAALYFDYIIDSSSVIIIQTIVNADMQAIGTETDDDDCPISHTRGAVISNCSSSYIIACNFTLSCKSISYDHVDENNSYVTSIAQAFGIYNSRNCILQDTNIDCSAASIGQHYEYSYIACALGNSVTYKNCSFSSSSIRDKGTNNWTSSYNFSCNQ